MTKVGLREEMSLLPRGGRYKTRLDEIIKELGPDGPELAEILVDPTVPGTTISDFLTSKGYDVSEASVRRYRKSLSLLAITENR